ncbi:MFS transporter [Isoptericola sp. F-RaC21]|uniref:MFS transporter n=1 Tax=Isoptericola sp. F-RaC21 TaxID=3141452 RepID=UPI00315BC1B8
MPSAPPTTSGRSRPLIFVLCWLCLLADGYDLMSYGATLPGLIGRPPLALTPVEAGHIGSLALVGMLVGSLVAGTLTDRVGRRRIFISSVAIFSLGMLLTSFASTPDTFLAARILTCFGVGGLLPTAVALATEFASPRTRSRTLALVLTGPPTGMVLAAAAAAWLVPTHGARPVYALAGAFLLLLPVLWLRLPESPAYLLARGRATEAAEVAVVHGLETPAPPATPTARTTVRTLLTPGMLGATLLIWATTFFSLLTVFGITTWLPQVMTQAGYGLGSSIRFLLVYCVGAVLGTVVAGRLADRVGPKPLVVVGYACAVAALLLIALRPPSAVLLVLVLVAGFGGFGTQNILNDFIARFYPPAVRATGLGWALGVGRLGGIVGPTFGAWVITQSAPLTATSLAFAATAALGGLVMLLVPKAVEARAATSAPDADPAASAVRPA